MKVDEKASCLVVKNFLRYNGPESPNVVKAWSSALDLIPECSLRVELIQQVKAFLKALPEAFREALPEAFAKSMPYQEQEQEQEQEDSYPPNPLSSGAERGNRKKPSVAIQGGWPSVEALIALYNETTPSACPSVESISEGRIKKAKAYLLLFPEREFWQTVFSQIGRSKFLRGFTTGKDGKPFVADFDWLLTKGRDGTENCVKVHDGKYS